MNPYQLFRFFSAGWEKNSRKVEAYVAVEICFGPFLVEEAVRKKSVYRNIVAWRGGPSTCQMESMSKVSGPGLFVTVSVRNPRRNKMMSRCSR